MARARRPTPTSRFTWTPNPPPLHRSLESRVRTRHWMKKLFLGGNPVRSGTGKFDGQQVVLDGEEFYRIANSDQQRPFFLSIVSSADHWMFISSNGALTAGRHHPDLALF